MGQNTMSFPGYVYDENCGRYVPAAKQKETIEKKIFVTPKIAKQYLARNTRNRPMNRGRLKALCALHLAGEFGEHADPIMFSATDGALGNGQHRLAMVVETGKGAPFRVWFNVPDEIIKRHDQGGIRCPSDVASFDGEILFPKAACPRIRVIGKLLGQTADRHPQMVPIYRVLKKGIDWSSKNIGLACRNGMGRAAVGAAMAIVAAKDVDGAGRFVEACRTLANLPARSPAHRLNALLKRNDLSEVELALETMKLAREFIGGRKPRGEQTVESMMQHFGVRMAA